MHESEVILADPFARRSVHYWTMLGEAERLGPRYVDALMEQYRRQVAFLTKAA